MVEFLNREEELERLEETYGRPGLQLVLVYGRRRVGKTHLLQEFVRGKDSIYYITSRKSEALQVAGFSDEMERVHPHATPLVFDAWADALRLLIDECRGRSPKLVVVLDEFSEIEKQNAAVPSEMNSIIERFGAECEIMIILCGSMIGQMERLAAPDQPLYRRFGQQLRIRPFEFEDACLFFPRWSFPRKVEAYAVLGGMPMYLSEAAQFRNLETFLERQVLNSKGLFFNEADVAVAQEVRGAGYLSVLEAIALGKNTTAEIASVVGQDKTSLGPYLKLLEALDLVSREVPVTEHNPPKSRKGIYKIKDNFLSFWYAYVNRYRAMIEADDPRVMEYVERDLSTRLGYAAEDIFRRAVRLENRRGGLPLALDRVGRYWNKNVYDIDVCGVGTSNDEYLWGECKWKASSMGMADFDKLKDRVRRSGINPGGRNHFVLCSKSGFTKELQTVARADGTQLWDAKALESIFEVI